MVITIVRATGEELWEEEKSRITLRVTESSNAYDPYWGGEFKKAFHNKVWPFNYTILYWSKGKINCKERQLRCVSMAFRFVFFVLFVWIWTCYDDWAIFPDSYFTKIFFDLMNTWIVKGEWWRHKLISTHTVGAYFSVKIIHNLFHIKRETIYLSSSEKS